MPGADQPRLRCFLAIPQSPEYQSIAKAITGGIEEAGFRIVRPDRDSLFPGAAPQEVVVGDLARADCVVADVTGFNPNVLFEIGVAQAMGKGLLVLVQEDAASGMPSDLRGCPFILYDRKRLGEFARRIAKSLKELRRFPRMSRSIQSPRFATPFFVEWERLDFAEAENLCRELLAQLGFRRLDWDKEAREFDLIAELPRKDPDGYEYRELWLIAMGRHAPPDMLLHMASRDPEMLVRHLWRYPVGSLRGPFDGPVTILIILLRGEGAYREVDELKERLERLERKGARQPSVRIRVWDREYLTLLVQRFPQIGFKYFSDEARSRSKYRKTPEELYKENVELANRQAKLIAELEDEKNKRVRAERDAVWKDISFSAAHKIGNPIFAIETDLDPLQKRVNENRANEASQVIGNIRSSVDKAKAFVEQFKSLARSQEIKTLPMPLLPVLEDACKLARNSEVICDIKCPADLMVQGDPERLSECFEELVANSIHWFRTPDKKIDIEVAESVPSRLPHVLDANRTYAQIHFRDSGCGVPLKNKSTIFDAFFTTQDHGTGLGLALVRRIIEGHGGTIEETGDPNQGADFEVYLPVPEKVDQRSAGSGGRRKRKREE